MTASGGADDERRPVAGHQDDPVGERHDALEPVLGHHHGQAEVVHQAGQRTEDLFGRGRIEGRGRLVEHQQPRRRGQDRPDGHPLLLAARERPQ